MNKVIQQVFLFLAFGMLIFGCRKKAWDDFYGRPDSLADPIYQQLSAKGNFKNLVALIDKSGYKETLSGAGYWTMFAPNDSAFTAYFKDKGIAGVNAIDSVSARSMMQYWLVYNAYEKDRLDDYQATINNAGWTPNIAFRRRTAYYSGFYKDTGAYNKTMVSVASNRNNNGAIDGNYVSSDFNNKYITYFTDNYFAANNLSASDYNYFYPNSQYTGFNVAEARVLTKDIPAENGIIHEIDKVISPLMSIDEYIRTKPEYSSFRAILNRLYTNNMVSFIYNADATHRYQVLQGKNDSVFVKVYSNMLAFSPNNENFLKAEDNDGQKDCWTMFIPTNKAVDDYVKNVLCQYYPSLDVMPANIIVDFLNSHLFPTVVWPSKFGVARNKLNETAKLDPASDIIDKKILSNGIIYGTNKVNPADIFSTVYSKAYLNPNYTLMTRALNESNIKLFIGQANTKVDILLVSDTVFKAAGFVYNVSKSQYEYNTSTSGAWDRLLRIVQSCVFYEPYKSQMDNLSGTGIVKSGDLGTDGDYIKFDNYTIVTAGLQDQGKVMKVDSISTASTNGTVYYVNQVPLYSEKPVGTHIKNLGLSTTSPYNYFWQFLSFSSIYNATTTEVFGLTGFTTVFVPTNTAIVQAVNDGLLPGTGTAPNKIPNFNPTSSPDKDLVRKFLQYHILSGRTVVPDGNLTGTFDSALKDDFGNSVKLVVNYDPSNVFNLFDNYNTTTTPVTSRIPAKIIPSASNNLSNRSVIHLIDRYLNYNINTH